MRIAFLMLGIVAAAGPALGQAAGPTAEPAPALDFGPMLSLVAEYVAVALGGLALWLFNRFVAPVLGEQAADSARAGLDRIIRNGIRLAVDRLDVADRLGAVEVRNELVREAAAYVIASAPGWLEKFNIGPDRVADMVRARLGQEMAAIATETAAAPGAAPGAAS